MRLAAWTGAALGALLMIGLGAAESPPDRGSPPPLSAYGDLPLISDVALSPSGARVAMLVESASGRIIADVDIASGASHRMALGDVKARGLMWANEERVVLVRSETANIRAFVGDKNEFFSATVLDLARNRSFNLFQDVPGFYPIITGPIDRVLIDGEAQIAAASVRIDGAIGYRSLSGFDPATGRTRKIDEDTKEVTEWLLHPNGEIAARSEYDRQTKVWTLRYRDGARWVVAYEREHPLDWPDLVGFGRDDKKVLLRFSGADAGYWEFDPSGRIGEALGQSHEWPLHHPATRLLVGFGAESDGDGQVRHRYFDPRDGKVWRAASEAFAEYDLYRIVDSADDPRKVLIYAEGAEEPGAYFFVDFGTGDFKSIGSTRPNIPAEWIADQQSFAYKAQDGLEIQAYLTLPPGREAKNLPLVVLPHGGPEAHDRAGFDWLAQAIASRGYAVLQPNYRGSSGFGRAFVEAGYGEWGRKMQTDLSDGVRHLAAEGTIDPKRVCIVGGSYGGYAALAGATIDRGVYACAVSINGVSNLDAMLRHSRSEAGFDDDAAALLYWRRFMGEGDLNAISPDRLVDRVEAPILLIHGKDDDIVPFSQSERMRDSLTRAGKQVEFVQLKGEDHWLSRAETRNAALEATIAFLQRRLPAN